MLYQHVVSKRLENQYIVVKVLKNLFFPSILGCGGSKISATRETKNLIQGVFQLSCNCIWKELLQDVRAAKAGFSRPGQCAKQDSAGYDTIRGHSPEGLHG
jgi:hypothetical protein